jgi:hypothetical protein
MMKKRLIFLPLLAGLLCFAAAGCSEKSIDTAKVRAAFPTVADTSKQLLEEGLADIDHSNYVAAVKPLRMFAFTTKMDRAQRKIMADTIARVNAKAAASK